MKLGEALVQKRLLSERQLAEALKAQLIFGGHLGTCLIELGYIDERSLGQALEELHRVPYVPPERLDNVPRQVLQLLPRELVVKHQAIPIELQDKRLSLAMIHPRDFLALDELGFASGYRIVPGVAPELRIVQALERYYEVPRRLRYVNTNLGAAQQTGRPAPAVPPAPRSATAGAADPAIAVAAPAASEGRVPATGLQAIAALLCRAPSPVDLATAVLDVAASVAERSILFRVHDGTARCWTSRGFDPAPAAREFDVATEPAFELVAAEPHYLGALPDDPRHRGFFARLEVEAATEVVLVPVRHGGRLVALCYGDSGTSMGLDERCLDEYSRLARLLGFGLGLIEIEQRVRAICG